MINAVSWGILLPIGVMSARYLRPFAWADPLWFYLHVTCQLTGYILGVVGWGLGLKLQKYATPIRYFHRNIGVAIFVFATLQVNPNFSHPLPHFSPLYPPLCPFLYPLLCSALCPLLCPAVCPLLCPAVCPLLCPAVCPVRLSLCLALSLALCLAVSSSVFSFVSVMHF